MAKSEQKRCANSQAKKDSSLIAELFGLCCKRCEDILVSIIGNEPSGGVFAAKNSLFDRSSLLNETTISDALSCFRPAVLRCLANNPKAVRKSTFDGHDSLFYLKGLQILWQTAFSALKRTLSAPKCLIVAEQAVANALSKIEHLYLHGARRYSIEDISKSFQAFLDSLPDLAAAIAQHDYSDPTGGIGSRMHHGRIKTNKIEADSYNNPIANEIINDPGCELFNDIEGMRLTGESVVSICEDFSRGHLHEKEFSEVSRTPSLYPYWAMGEGAREIKEIWKLTPFYLGKTDTLPKRTKLLSKYLDWNCNYSFWQAIDKFYRSAIQGDIKYNDSDIMMIHYLGTVYGKSIKLINSLHGRWLEFDLNKLGNHLYALLQSKNNDKEFLHDLVLQELDVIKKWVRILHDELPEFELARLRGEMPTQNHKESEGITMFPFEKKFKLIGQPNFIVPEDKQVALGRQLEKIAKAQEFKFKETAYLAPKHTDGNCDFEYRIQDKIDPDSDHYTIYFNYFKSNNILRIYSFIPAARTMPLVEFIVENYLQVHLGKEISTSYGLEPSVTKNSPPKRNAHSNKRKGSGLRGTRTKMMREQFKGFCEFLKTNPISEIGQGKTVGARASQFWATHQKTFERATKAIGEKHGYPNAKAIASAYRASKN